MRKFLAEPGVRVLGLTTVAGNVGLEQATQNALLTAEICNSDVPVFMNAEKPLRGGEGIPGSSQFRRSLRNRPCGHS